MEGTDDRIHELEDKTMEITQSQCRASGTWDCNKRSDIYVFGISEGKEKKSRAEKVLKEIMVEKLPKFGKRCSLQIEEAEQIPKRINP